MTTTLNEYLENIYFNPAHPAAFGGVKRLYNAAKKHGYHPSLKYIQEWLQNQESYSINKPTRNNFPRRRIVVSGRDALWDADLGDVQDIAEDNDGTKFLLILIDALSKYMWVRPLVSKRAVDVKKAVEDVLDSTKRKPKQLRTDKGGEFNNKLLKKLLKDRGIYYYTSQNEGKASFAEIGLKTLKTKIMRYIVHTNSVRYIDDLQKFVKSYNNAKHRTINMAPSKVTKKVVKTLWWKMYRPKKPPPKVKPYKFRVNDTVRVSLLKEKFDRQYSQTFSREYFIVSHRFRVDGLAQYRLKDQLGEEIRGEFFEGQLQKIIVDPNQPFKIEKVLRTRTRNNRKEKLVRFLGYSKKFDKWLPASEVESL